MKRGARMQRLVIVAALAVGLAMPAWGQDFDAGLAAYERGEYAVALEEWKPLAEQGDADAQLRRTGSHAGREVVPADDE